MGQSVPPKYFLPQTPVGASQATNTVNPVQPTVQNPQVPLLPPNFGQQSSYQATQNPFGPSSPTSSPQTDLKAWIQNKFFS